MARNRIPRSKARLALVLGLYLLPSGTLGCSDDPTGPPDPNALAILFIGNSLTYTNDLPALLEQLLEVAQDDPVHIESVALPDYGLPDHWVSGSSRKRIASEQVSGIFFPAGAAWQVAWETDPGLALYGPDGFHPTLLGSYLVAVVMMQRLTGYDPRDLPPFIQRSRGKVQLDPEVAQLIHEAAAEANRRNPGT